MTTGENNNGEKWESFESQLRGFLRTAGLNTTAGVHYMEHENSAVEYIKSYIRQNFIHKDDLIGLVEGVIDYTEHARDCILAQFEAGEPTKDGYRQKFAGKWYTTRPVDNSPDCDCGLDKAVAVLKDPLSNKEQ